MEAHPISNGMKKKLLLIFILSFAFNLIWENLHAPLYYLPSGESISQAMLLRATIFDALFITILGFTFLSFPYFRKRPRHSVLIGILVSTIIEMWAIGSQRWAYTSAMPLIPFLGVGLTPTIQLGFLAYVIFKIVGLGKVKYADKS